MPYANAEDVEKETMDTISSKESPRPLSETEEEEAGHTAKTQESISTSVEKLREAEETGIVGAHIFGALDTIKGENSEEHLDLLTRIYEEKGIEDAQWLAREALALHKSPLFQDLENKARTAFEKKEEEEDESYNKRIASLVTEAKKPFFELLASRKLSAADINSLLAGGIRFAPKPPSNIGYAVASVSTREGQGRISLYESFFSEENQDRAHVVKHELGHLIAGHIFAGQLDILKQYARQPEASLDEIQQPNLRMIVAMTRHPKEAAAREHRGENSHLHRELTKLSQARESNSPEAKEMAAQLVSEILADRVANYFEAGGNLEQYGTLRFASVSEEVKEAHFLSESSLFQAIDKGLSEKGTWRVTQESAGKQFPPYEDEIYYESPEPIKTAHLASSLKPTATVPGAPSKTDVLGSFLKWLTNNRQ